jgi:histidinol-phosphate aminotransferase
LGVYLMCPPAAFAVDYSINVWMRPEVPVDTALAVRQWNRLRDVYRDLGHRVAVLEPVPGLPDLVFTANAAVVLDGAALVARFRAAERGAEEPVFLKWFEEQGFRTSQAEAVNEGEGDFLVLEDRILAGHGFRSEPGAAAEVAQVFGREVVGLTLVDPRFYHLDNAVTVLDGRQIAYYPPAFSPDSRDLLRQLYPDAILAEEADAVAFGLNAMSDGHTVIMPETAPRLQAAIRDRGFEVIGTDVTEFLKGGGGIKCLTLELRGMPAQAAEPEVKQEPAQGTAVTGQLLNALPAPEGADVLRLHCNESPYGAPPAALEAAAAELREHHNVYPDHESSELTARLAAALDVTPDMIVVANGADELIQQIVLTFRDADKADKADSADSADSAGPVAVTTQTFPGYAAAASVAGAPLTTIPMADHRVVPEAVAAALRDGARLAFVCNPHNPCGTTLDRAAVTEIITAAETTGAVPVFDEAYIEFADPEHDVTLAALREGRRAVVLRTFSKAWGLAGLRVGYAVGPADVMALIRRTRQSTPFSVNRLAQRAAVAALDTPGHLADIRAKTAAARERLVAGLQAAGVECVPSQANFVLARFGPDSSAVARALATDHGVLVRDLAPLGLPGFVRVTVGTEAQVDRFHAAVSAVRAASDPAPDSAPDPESE